MRSNGSGFRDTPSALFRPSCEVTRESLVTLPGYQRSAATDDPGDFVGLLVRWKDSPTSAGFNHIANARQPNQRLVIPESRDGTAIITVEGAFLNGGTASVDLRVSDTISPLVEDMVPANQGIGGDRLVRARTLGARFTPDTEFILERSDCPDECIPVGSCSDYYPAIRIDAVYPDTAEVKFSRRFLTPRR